MSIWTIISKVRLEAFMWVGSICLFLFTFSLVQDMLQVTVFVKLYIWLIALLLFFDGV